MPESANLIRIAAIAGFATALASATTAHAGIAALLATDSGFVTETGGTDKFDGTISPATGNYSVGYEVACPGGGLCAGGFIPMQRKNYFVFDLGIVTGPITGATLKLFSPIGGYESTDASETFVIGATDPSSVSTILSLIDGIGSVTGPGDVAPLIGDAVALYTGLADSLGMGAALGDPVPAPLPGIVAEAIVTAADDGLPEIDIAFTPFGIGYLNDILALGTDLVLGGAVPTAVPPSPLPQSLFGFTSAGTLPAPTLVLDFEPASTIPEPGSLSVLAMGLGATALWRRKRRVRHQASR